jgi:uncharacterized membrane protein YcaP (DUF421 family)
MLAVQIPIVEKILRTVLVYATILILFRLPGNATSPLSTCSTSSSCSCCPTSSRTPSSAATTVSWGIIGAVTLVAVNAALNRWLAVSKRAARVLEGKPTTIIENGRFLPGAARRLSLRPVDVEHAIRVQNGDDVTEAATGVMEPSGQLVLTLKKEEQSASKGDIAGLSAQLTAMQASLELLAASR